MIRRARRQPDQRRRHRHARRPTAKRQGGRRGAVGRGGPPLEGGRRRQPVGIGAPVHRPTARGNVGGGIGNRRGCRTRRSSSELHVGPIARPRTVRRHHPVVIRRARRQPDQRRRHRHARRPTAKRQGGRRGAVGRGGPHWKEAVVASPLGLALPFIVPPLVVMLVAALVTAVGAVPVVPVVNSTSAP